MCYEDATGRIWHLIDESTDWIAALSTIVCELHTSFDYFDWTGFYRTIRPEHLQVGPYQGGHGCVDIPFSRGVCGAAAQSQITQLIEDVDTFEGHIACSSSTRSEIVIPIIDLSGKTMAVLDVDSNQPAAFDAIDRQFLEEMCLKLGMKYGGRHIG